MSDTIKYLLPESEILKSWYNIIADLPEPPPPVLHPGTGKPIGPDDLAPLFPIELILQEVREEHYLDIPEPVPEIYLQWRPSSLYRARKLEKVLDRPAKIFYKYEGVSPTGSHKSNTAVAQAFYNKEVESSDLLQKQVRDNGGVPWPLPGQFLGFPLKYTWSGSASNRNPIVKP